jgi:hypothetical protein
LLFDARPGIARVGRKEIVAAAPIEMVIGVPVVCAQEVAARTGDVRLMPG